MESLTPWDKECGLVWKSTGTLENIRSVKRINDDFIDPIFGPGKNGIRYRACCRLKGGNYDMTSLQHALVKVDNGEGTGVDAVAIRIKVTPSMKSDDYWSILVFQDKADGALFLAPHSGCECPCGLAVCSHSLGQMGIMYLIQSRKYRNYNMFSAALPPPIKFVVKKPIPWSFAFDNSVGTTM
jgi:hypothetical protein